jgi:hypothetical protein
MSTPLGKPYVSTAFTVGCIVLLSGICFGRDFLLANAGLLDAREWNFEEKRLALNGNWEFYGQQLLTPAECRSHNGTLVPVPSVWNDLPKKSPLNFGTYYLRVLLPSSLKELTIEIPQLYNSYGLWINDVFLGGNGKVGTTKDETRPQWLPQNITFRNSGDTLEIVLQVANFYHHKGGIREPLYLGAPQIMNTQRGIAVGTNLTEAIILSLEALLFLFFFTRRKSKKILLYFGLLCLSWAIRSLFSNLYLGITWWPEFNWTATVKIEYLTLYFIMIWSLLSLEELFPDFSSKLFRYLMVMANVFFILFTLLTPPGIFTKWLNLYLMTAVVALVYAIIVIVRALIHEKSGAWFLITSMVLGIVVMGYDIVAYGGLLPYHFAVTKIGYILIFILLTMGLLMHLTIINTGLNSSSTLTYRDFYEKNPQDKTGK